MDIFEISTQAVVITTSTLHINSYYSKGKVKTSFCVGCLQCTVVQLPVDDVAQL